MFDNKFKILVIGDSIAQGFNSKTGSFTYGFKNYNEKFSKGLSYGDFLLELFYNDIQTNKALTEENKIKIWNNIEYQNISLAITRIEDYINLLDNNYDNDELFKIIALNNKINENSKLGLECPNSFWNINNEINLQKNFSLMSEKLNNHIKNSNLLLLSLGGNDYQSSLPYQYINYLIHEKNYYSIKKIKQLIIENIQKILDEMKIEYIKFIQKVININPNLKILVVGYSPSFFPLLLKIEELIKKKNPSLFSDFFKIINKLLEDSLCEIASITSVKYIKVFDFRKWRKKANIFYENAIDVHPTELGYQQIAKSIYIYLLKNKLIYFLNSNLKNISVKKLIKITERYKNDFLTLFDLHKIKNNNILNILNSIFSLQKSVGNPYFRILVKNFDSNKIPDKIISRSEYLTLSNVLSENLFYIINKLENSEIKKIFKEIQSNNNDLIKIIGYILNSQELNFLINNFEINFFNYKYVNIKHFFTLYVRKNKKQIFDLIKKIIQNNKIKLKDYLIKIINAVKKDFNNHNILPIFNEDVKEFLYKLSFDENSIITLNKILDSFIMNIDNMKLYDDFDSFFNAFIILEQNLIKNYLHQLLLFINGYFSKYKNKLALIVLTALKINIDNLSDRDWRKMNKIFNLFFNTLNDNKKKIV